MKNNIKPRPSTRVKFRRILIVSSVFAFAAGIFILLFNIGPKKDAVAAPATKYIATGSFIINMGVTPQTVNNGLKPYGLVYDLIVNHQIPVIWSIEPSKAKDGIDFIHNGVSYKGGPFIIESAYIDSAIQSVISSWLAQGVTGSYTVSPITVPVNQTLTSFPRVMIDTTSSLQAIIVSYFNNASIPATAYDFGSPAYLTNCHDVWANPHGDPEWSTHSYLYDFVTVQKSWIWAQCHSVSELESCKSQAAPVKQLNFLSSNGLKCWNVNKCSGISESHTKPPVAPFTNFYPADPVMQYMGTMNDACKNGSEQWFQPRSTGSWRSTTKRGVTTGTGTSPGEGALIVYGPAFGDASNGWVMYEGGHSLDSGGSSIPDKVAAERAFMNFLLCAGVNKSLVISTSIGNWMAAGQSVMINAYVSQGSAPYTYKWTSKIGGTFSAATSSTTQYTAPLVQVPSTDIIKLLVTDNCGRKKFETFVVNIDTTQTLPISLLNFKGESKKNSVSLKWETSTEVNNDFFTIMRSRDAISYEEIGTVKGKGNSSINVKYAFIDNDPFEMDTYYKLSQTDYDGNTESFPPIRVKYKPRKSELETFPNPFDKKLNLLIESEVDVQATIKIFSVTGVKVIDRQTEVMPGSNSISIETEKLSPGTYYLNMYYSNGEGMVSRKIFKK